MHRAAFLHTTVLLALTLLLAGCPAEREVPEEVEEDEEEEQDEPRFSDRVRIEVSVDEREAYIFFDGAIIRTEPVAVGSEDYETPLGHWHIFRIDFNPDWTPPDSEWTEGYEYTPPGDPDNPMGRVRMIFNPPYSIHGTEDLASLGQAASHGSIRMANEAALEIAWELMHQGGVARPQAWLQRVLADSTRMEAVELVYQIPIQVRE